jgi:hypothetical protein
VLGTCFYAFGIGLIFPTLFRFTLFSNDLPSNPARQQAATIPAATASRWNGNLPPWNHNQRAPSIDNALTLRITIFSEADTPDGWSGDPDYR